VTDSLVYGGGEGLVRGCFRDLFCLAMLASFLQSYCELSGPMLGLGHDGRGGGAVCGHGVGDLASCLSSWFRTQYSEMVGEEVVISDSLVTHLVLSGLQGEKE